MVLVAKKIATVAAAVVTLGSSTSSRLPHTPVDGSQTAPLPADLQRAREAVWRAWFANDRETLERLLPDDFVGIGWGGGPWDSQETALAGAAGFAASGPVDGAQLHRRSLAALRRRRNGLLQLPHRAPDWRRHHDPGGARDGGLRPARRRMGECGLAPGLRAVAPRVSS